MKFLIIISLLLIYDRLAHYISYTILKNKTLKKRKWDLNISCGKTDGGGINTDIKKHADVPNFMLVKDIYNLPFKDKQFEWVLSSHTIEHVEYPEKFFKELKRVGKNVVIVVPPLWDIGASIFGFPYHRWTFLTFTKEHTKLPRHFPAPLSKTYMKLFGQRMSSKTF